MAGNTNPSQSGNRATGNAPGSGGQRSGGNFGRNANPAQNRGTRTVSGGGLGGSAFSGRMRGAPGTGIGPGLGGTYMGGMIDASDRTNRGFTGLATNALKFMTPLQEFAPSYSTIQAAYNRGQRLPSASWGADPLAVAGGLAGGAVFPGAGMITGPVAGWASRMAGYPAGIVDFGEQFGSNLAWNDAGRYDTRSFGRASQPARSPVGPSRGPNGGGAQQGRAEPQRVSDWMRQLLSA